MKKFLLAIAAMMVPVSIAMAQEPEKETTLDNRYEFTVLKEVDVTPVPKPETAAVHAGVSLPMRCSKVSW